MNLIQRHKGFFVVLVISLVLFFSLVGFWTGFHTKVRLETFFKDKTGLTLQIGTAYIYPFTGTGFLRNLRIANPEGSSFKNAISVKEISFSGSLKTFYSDIITFRSMRVRGMEVHYEPNGEDSNLQRLFISAIAYAQSNDSYNNFKSVSMKRLRMDPIHLVFGNVMVNKTISLDSAEFNDLGTEDEAIHLFKFRDIFFETYIAKFESAIKSPDAGLDQTAQRKIESWIQWWKDHHSNIKQE